MPCCQDDQIEQVKLDKRTAIYCVILLGSVRDLERKTLNQTLQLVILPDNEEKFQLISFYIKCFEFL